MIGATTADEESAVTVCPPLRHQLVLAGYSCARCGRGASLDVHHADGYRRLGRERPEELQALCRDCHTVLHASSEWVNVGCVRTLVWVVVIAVAMQLVWWLLVSVIRGVGVS